MIADFQGVDDEGLAGEAELAFVGRVGEKIGLLYHREVYLGIDPPDDTEQGRYVPAAYFQFEICHGNYNKIYWCAFSQY